MRNIDRDDCYYKEGMKEGEERKGREEVGSHMVREGQEKEGGTKKRGGKRMLSGDQMGEDGCWDAGDDGNWRL